MNSVIGPFYPVSGTIGLDGQPVTFKFDKIYKGNDSYKVTVQTDVKDINTFLLWKIVLGNKIINNREKGNNDISDSWKRIAMKSSGKILTGELPEGYPGQKIAYRVELNYKNKQYYLPVDKPVTIELWGKVNPGIIQLYYFILFGGLILAVRTGLEVFKTKPKIGVYTVFTLIFFFLYTICIVPLTKTYELNAINHSVPPVSQLLTLQSILLLILWIVGMSAIFNFKGNKIIPPLLSALTLVIYLAVFS
jgi:hypothetical protein